MGFLGFGKKTYYVEFKYDDISLALSKYIDTPNVDEALQEAQEDFDISKDYTGTWTVEEATDLPRKKFLGLF